MRVLSNIAVLCTVTFAAATPAWAGLPLPAAPGPLVGAGVPALLGLAYLYKRLRARR